MDYTWESLVRKGMAYLDEHFPGHDRRVRLHEFWVGDGMKCALAQASGKPYSDACLDLKLLCAKARDLGFDIPVFSNAQAVRDLAALDAEWRKQYLERALAIAKADNSI